MSATSTYCSRHEFQFSGKDCPWCEAESRCPSCGSTPQPLVLVTGERVGAICMACGHESPNPRTVEQAQADRAIRLGRNVERMMDKRRMSFMDMAKAAGVSKTCIAKVIAGETDARSSTLFAIADFFGVTLNDLYADHPSAAVSLPGDEQP